MSNNSVKIAGMIVGGIIILALIGLIISTQISPVSGNLVNVQGSAEIKAVPDLVSVYFSVQTNGTTAAEAKDKNSEIVDELITNLIKQGFERKDIVTENFNIYPDYYWDGNKQVSRGYLATHSIKVQISTDNAEKIGDVIDAGADAGAMIGYINFELSLAKQNEYKAEALKQATQDARVKAEAIASGLGKKVGKLVSVSDSSFDYYPWPVYTNSRMDYSGAAEAKIATTSIQPGQQTINARVSVSYRI
jgi:uncharacterized protein YggE